MWTLNTLGSGPLAVLYFIWAAWASAINTNASDATQGSIGRRGGVIVSSSMRLSVAVVALAVLGAAQGARVQYNTAGGPVPNKLNVHIVPHTHDGAWLGGAADAGNFGVGVGCCSIKMRCALATCPIDPFLHT
jgi:hypothetical protein